MVNHDVRVASPQKGELRTEERRSAREAFALAVQHSLSELPKYKKRKGVKRTE